MIAPNVMVGIFLLLAAPASAQYVAQVDLKLPGRPVSGPGEALVVLRPWADSMAGDNRILFDRVAPPGSSKATPEGFRITFGYTIFGGKKGERALRVAVVPAGDYLLASRTNNGTQTDSFCLGAPRFTVAAGAVLYLGDYRMVSLARMADGDRRSAMAYSGDLEGARTALRAEYPALADRLAAWAPVNGATFRCDGDEFTAYAVPGAPSLPPSAPAPSAPAPSAPVPSAPVPSTIEGSPGDR